VWPVFLLAIAAFLVAARACGAHARDVHGVVPLGSRPSARHAPKVPLPLPEASTTLHSRTHRRVRLSRRSFVRLAYLDEAGTSKNEPVTVVAGVVVDGDQLTEVRTALGKVMRDHIRQADQATLVLRTAEVYGGTGYFDERRRPEWTWERRAEILAHLAEVPAALDLQLAWGPVHRKQYPHLRQRHAGSGLTGPELIAGAAYMVCLMEVDLWLRENAPHENCLFIVEDHRETRQFLKGMLQEHARPADAAAGSSAVTDRRIGLPLHHVQEAPTFQERQVAHPLILADFVAYLVKRRLMGDTRSVPFSEPWIRRNAGLKVTVS
jgi:hypothetical protein